MKFMFAFLVAALAAISPAAANLRRGEEDERELTSYNSVHCGVIKEWRVYVPGVVVEYNPEPSWDSNTPGTFLRLENGGSYSKDYFLDYNIMAYSEEWFADKTVPDESCGCTNYVGYDFPACAYVKLSKWTLKDGK
jgi:hypothetical protein